MTNEYGMLPCPFCGDDSKLEPDEVRGVGVIHAGCENCGGAGPEVDLADPNRLTPDDLKVAVSAWNNRK